jgi:RNA 2',3'-cyclic 3'-phosphodiesterase
VIEFFRTFIAIELPANLRANIAAYIQHLRREIPDVRASWNREENLHLTLKFLGDVPIARVQQISESVELAAQPFQPFELVVTGCGIFPPRGRPNVLWLGVSDLSNNLGRLHHGVEEQCELMGFERESRPFHPHLTIARLRRPQGASQLGELHKQFSFGPAAFTVSEVVVFRSELLPAGSRHTAVSRHKLHGA